MNCKFSFLYKYFQKDKENVLILILNCEIFFFFTIFRTNKRNKLKRFKLHEIATELVWWIDM